MSVKIFRSNLIKVVLLTLILTLSTPDIVYAESGSNGSWCTVTIKQGGVDHPSGCTVCSLQLILQNSGQLKENQLSGSITSVTEAYKNFETACKGAGFQTGDSWVLGSVVSGFNSLCSSGWSNYDVKEQYNSYNYNSLYALTGSKFLDFKAMGHADQLTCMKALYNSGYFVIFCVEYKESGKTKGNGKGNYTANHATMLAGVTDDQIWLNDPATGTIVKYSEAKGSGCPYNLVYCLVFKNDKVSPVSLAGGTAVNSTNNNTDSTNSTDLNNNTDAPSTDAKVDITEDDKQNAEKLGIPVEALTGAYSESQLSSIFAMNEVQLDVATADSLTIDQNYTLNNWKDNVDSGLEESILVTWMRRIVTITGILFTIWMIFLYLAYWFDRVNVFFEFSLLNILSFNRLTISPDERDCTWQLSELVRNKSHDAMTVNHRAMIELVIIGLLFGSLIISGMLFKIIRLVIFGILKFLNII